MNYYIWVLGCAMNKSDAERIASVLCDAGYIETKVESEADIVITVACSVRQSGINRIYGKIKEWEDIRKKRPLITALSGCVLPSDRKKMDKFFDLIFEINGIKKLTGFLPSVVPSLSPVIPTLSPVIPSVAEGSLKKHRERDFSARRPAAAGSVGLPASEAGMTNQGDFFKIHPKYNSDFQAFVPISTGCNNFCTYCAVPHTRGREVSRPLDEILAEIRHLVSGGYKEITLLGQNVNSYGNDLTSPVIPNEAEGSLKNKLGERDFSARRSAKSVEMTNSFTKLLKKIDEIPGDWRAYFYSNHPKDMSDELINTLAKLKHFPHYIHLPIQSGSDKILKAMNRHYTQKNYFSLVHKIREAMPDVAITTDIIVGFPGETEENFKQTKEVMKKVGFSMPFIAKFSPRPGTKAAKMEDDVSKEEKERRWRELTNLQKEILKKENKKLAGKTLRVLIDSKKNDKYYGRTDSYKVVEIVLHNEVQRPVKSNLTAKNKKQTSLLGQFVKVKIIESGAWKLKGEIS